MIHRRWARRTAVFAWLGIGYLGGISRPCSASEDVLLSSIREELDRSWTLLQERDEPPYYIQIGVVDARELVIEAANGASGGVVRTHLRDGDIDIRIGSMELDNTHEIREQSRLDSDFRATLQLPIDDDPVAIRMAIWRAMDDTWRASARRLIRVSNNEHVMVSREESIPDFSTAPVVRDLHEIVPISVDVEEWEDHLRDLSALVLDYPGVLDSNLTLRVADQTRYISNTEGTEIRQQSTRIRISIRMSTVADDGMELEVHRVFDARTMTGLPSLAVLESEVRAAAERLDALSRAPIVDPYVGPAILRGRAAAVFFHEILGHRVEGHRFRDQDEGQTLRDQVGEAIFPSFIDVVDDPTMEQIGGIDLMGHYDYDDEGVPSERVRIVEDGVLRGFLTSRVPVPGFEHSNGHGRRQVGNAVVSRQGNLRVIAEDSDLGYAELREALIAEVIEQDRPFGLIFDEISGGFTFTGRTTPNSYAVQPLVVWRVYPDGRPDELVRGVDVIGTPLTTFSRILAASNTVSVFNGVCGAESGWVPVSASSPDLLISEVEVQRKDQAHQRPPLLDPPAEVSE